MNDDTISRQATIEHLKKRLIETAINNTGVTALCDSIFEDTAENRIGTWLNEVPSAQPEITLESAIDYLHSIGWMQNHDRILTESARPDIRLFGDYMILPDIPTPDEKQKITDELMKKLLNDLKKSGVVEFVWHLDGERKTVGVKLSAVMPEPYKEKL